MDDKGRNVGRVSEKWGFGMAPPKPHTQKTRQDACEQVKNVLERGDLTGSDTSTLESVSIVKGMFNRIVREDQWDWFTVAGQLGYPPRHVSKLVAQDLGILHKAVKSSDEEGFSRTCTRIIKIGILDCLSIFLGRVGLSAESNSGWIYVLSTRDIPDLLKIGMTTRDVVQRAREINSATGVVVPFGVRRCWRVGNPREAEQAVHRRLISYRVRDDREFFRIPFKTASECIDEVMSRGGFELGILSNNRTVSRRE